VKRNKGKRGKQVAREDCLRVGEKKGSQQKKKKGGRTGTNCSTPSFVEKPKGKNVKGSTRIHLKKKRKNPQGGFQTSGTPVPKNLRVEV